MRRAIRTRQQIGGLPQVWQTVKPAKTSTWAIPS